MASRWPDLPSAMASKPSASQTSAVTLPESTISLILPCSGPDVSNFSGMPVLAVNGLPMASPWHFSDSPPQFHMTISLAAASASPALTASVATPARPHSIRKLRRSRRPDLKAIAPSRARSFRKALSCMVTSSILLRPSPRSLFPGTAPGLMRVLRPLLRRHRPRPRPERHRSSRDRRLVSPNTAPCCARRGREPRSSDGRQLRPSS